MLDHVLHKIKIPAVPFVPVIFWFLIYFIMCFFDRNQLPLFVNLVSNGFNLSVYVLLIYLNINYLIPEYLNEGKFWKYLGLVILGILLIAPIRIFMQILVLREFPQAMNSYQSGWSLLLLSDFLVLMSSTMYSVISDWLKKSREIEDLEKTRIQSEIKFLKSQINPHFLFNTLNSLYALSLKKQETTPDMILRLSDIMRYILYECNDETVNLKKEVDYLINYIELEKLRHGSRLQLKVDTSGDLEEFLIVPMILNPFLENSFKHGIAESLNEPYLSMEIAVTPTGDLRFYIENSFETKKTATKSAGIGIENVKRRLQLLYPDKHQLTIDKKDNLFVVDLKMTLSKSY